MRNLELLRPLVLPTIDRLAELQCLCVNVDVGHVYGVRDDTLCALAPETGEVLYEVSFSSVLPPSSDVANAAVACHYLSDLRQVVVAYSNGDVITLETAMCSEGATGAVPDEAVDCIGTIDAGIAAMCWSPDEELGAFLSGDGKLVLMTKDFETLAETVVEVTEFGASAFVNVGWGSKETQFHGSEGKEAAKVGKAATMPAKVWDDRQPRVSWRGDGQCLAVSCVSAESGARKIRMYSREGVHLFTSEDVDGLEQALTWKPSGSLLGTSQRLPHRHDIVFFEKNGLRHGEFTLPFKRLDVRVRELVWNTDSTVLAVWCETLPDGVDEKGDKLVPRSNLSNPPRLSYVLLYTFTNYHYYLKQQLQWTGQALQSVDWDPETALRLHVMTAAGQYGRYDWYLATSVTPGLSPSNAVTVSVTDGAKLLQTPLRQVVVPPPMSHRSVPLPCPAAQCASIAASSSSSDCPGRFAVLLGDGRVSFYEEQALPERDQRGKDQCGFRLDSLPPSCMGNVNIPHITDSGCWDGHCVRHLVWFDANTLLAVAWDTNTAEDYLLVLDVAFTNGPEGKVTMTLRSSLALEMSAYRLVVDIDHKVAALELSNASVWKVNVPDCANEEIAIDVWPCEARASPHPFGVASSSGLCLPVPCSNIALCHMSGQEVVLSLTDHYRLFVDNIEIANNCTSIAVHDQYLVYTTHSHTCHCVSLNTPRSALSSLKDADRQPLDECVRRVERGSRIVGVVPLDTKLVLQMPRGNLETIHPRSLVLSATCRHIKDLQFVPAMDIMRRHRINMNLLYDYQPEVFLANTELFVKQVNNVSKINLFLADLKDEDVTRTTYSSCNTSDQSATTTPEDAAVAGKTALVCDELRGAMVAIDEKRFLHSILLTHIRKLPPQLEDVLACIKRLRDSSVLSASDITDAIKFILYSVDVNLLYDIALGMYDVDLVLMVAEKSQKDPKEYVPFLNSIRYMTPFDKYTIDMYLQRYSKALTHISQCEDKFETAFELITAQHLYKQALELYAGSPEFAKRIAEVYGNRLTDKKYHSEAALVFCKYQLYGQALPCLVKAVNWRQAVVVARKLSYTHEAMLELAESLADVLKSERRLSEAVQVLVDYAENHELAISLALDGHLWEEAMRLMYRFDRIQQVDSDLRPALLQACQVQLDALKKHQSTFQERTSRLAVVRTQKIKLRQQRLEMGLPIDGLDSDLYSNASSLASRTSAGSGGTSGSGGSNRSKQTARTAKNRRKAERKKYRLREGSVHEEEALLDSLSDIITAVDNYRGEIAPMLRVLYSLDEVNLAYQLQQLFTIILKLISMTMSTIWKPVSPTVVQVPARLGPNATAADFINQHMRQTASDELPVVGPPAPVFSDDLSSWKLCILEE